MHKAVKLIQHTTFILLLASLAACGGKKSATKEQAQADGKNIRQVVDITRPPEVSKNRTEATTELDPDETISYEKWKEQQVKNPDE